EGPAVHRDALLHPYEPVPRGVGRAAHRYPMAGPVVGHVDPDLTSVHLDPDTAAGRSRVLDDVGQGLLHDPVHRHPHPLSRPPPPPSISTRTPATAARSASSGRAAIPGAGLRASPASASVRSTPSRWRISTRALRLVASMTRSAS